MGGLAWKVKWEWPFLPSVLVWCCFVERRYDIWRLTGPEKLFLRTCHISYRYTREGCSRDLITPESLIFLFYYLVCLLGSVPPKDMYDTMILPLAKPAQSHTARDAAFLYYIEKPAATILPDKLGGVWRDTVQ